MSATPLEPRISVLILTRNRPDVLRTCIRSILRQQFGDFEIVILDDASTGVDTASTVAQDFADERIRPYRTESSLGVAGGRNLLMAKARGELLVTIDDDAVFVRENALDEVCRAFDRSSSIGVVAFKIVNIVDGHRQALAPVSRLGAARNRDTISQPALVSSFRGCGHAFRREVIARCGGYRPDLVFAGEEWDLAYRAIQAGFQIAYEPTIEVDHFPLPSVLGKTKARRSSEVFYQIRNHAYLAYRYLPWRYAFPYMGSWLLRCTLRSLRENSMIDLVRGAFATPGYLRGVKREVLDRKALGYLAEHGGGRGTIYQRIVTQEKEK